ncbi:hypothetical protein ACJRO7_009934 [Eucalyptus globulus]|uniref:Uncharacterized protein n=1 Tax=Eucalyptus globulus TaxID=34317 RepID=A0ABD3LDY3_EUCGL
MHGQGVMLVLEKRLCATDLKRHNGWLSIPRGQIRANFLTNGEIRALDNKKAIAVSLIEPCLQVRHGLQLQKWNNVRNHFSYVLTKEWTKGGLVQLWSFRANGAPLFLPCER